MVGLFTTEKGDVSSAKSLTVEVIFSDKSLIYTKKNRGPKMDSCGTPALTVNQFDDCPLSITRWNLLLRKLLISDRASPEIPTCHSYGLICHGKRCQKLLTCLEIHLKLQE